jgi:hypothetical protein
MNINHPSHGVKNLTIATRKQDWRPIKSKSSLHDNTILVEQAAPCSASLRTAGTFADKALTLKTLMGDAEQSRNINFRDITLGRVIGEGSFGKVREGKWRGRPVAVKLLICQDLGQDILEEFQSEVKIMSVLRHPNICRLLGACMEPANRCLVVELLPRGSLWDVLRTTSHSINEPMRIRYNCHLCLKHVFHFRYIGSSTTLPRA